MRLRTYESFWILKNGLLHTYPSLQENLSCDIVVVGTGITGALTSHALKKKGYKVIVVDKHDVASGSTSATTSMLQYEIDKTLTDLGQLIGEPGAELCYAAGVTAIDELAKLVSTEKIDCGFELKDSLYMAHDSSATKDLKTEFENRKKMGLPVRWLSAAQVLKAYKLKCYGAILSKKGASVDAYRLAHGLFHKNSTAKRNPLQVFDQSSIKEVKELRSSVLVQFDNGSEIKCKKIVYCNGFEATTMLKEKVASLFDTYAVISERIPEMHTSMKKTLFWDTNSPYLYMRSTDDGRLLVGGEDSSFRMELLRQKLKSHKGELLKEKLKDIAPGFEFIDDFTWAGTFGETKDGLPYIGKSSEFKHSYFVLGFGGNGITFSAQAMKILPALLEGKDHPLAQFYAFGR